MTNPELELVWDGGSLDLLGENDTPYGPVQIRTLSTGTEWGNPQSVRRALFSALADGSASALERHDNRTITVKLKLTAADSAALAGGEAPLHMLSGVRRAELRWTPPNDFAAPAVYIVVASDLTHQMDDRAENRVQRVYTLTLTCLPFALSLDPVVIEALPPFVAAPATLDACTLVTGWSSPAATFSVVSGGVQIQAPLGFTPVTLTKAIARSERYLALEVEALDGAPHFTTLSVTTTTGTSSPPTVGREGRWYFFDMGTDLGDLVSFTFDVFKADGTVSPALRVLTIAESATPAASVGRQSLRIIPTPGSARADGSLLIESRDAADDGTGTTLGQVIVYTGPQYDPRLSPWRTDTPDADPGSLSGQSVTMTPGDPFTFTRPASDFINGSHGLWVQAQSPDASTVDWTITVTLVDSVGTALRTLTTVTATSNHPNGFFRLHNLGVLDLPGFDAGAASQFSLRFEFDFAAAGSVTMGEALVFNRPLGRLTIVDTTNIPSVVEGDPGVWEAATGATRLWLDAASVSNNQRIIAGRPSRALSIPVSLLSELLSLDGSHLFTPDETYLYVGTSECSDPKVTGDFRTASHTHPAA